MVVACGIEVETLNVAAIVSMMRKVRVALQGEGGRKEGAGGPRQRLVDRAVLVQHAVHSLMRQREHSVVEEAECDRRREADGG